MNKPKTRKLFTVSVLALLLVSMFGGLGVWQIKPAQATTTSFGYAIVGGSDYETFGHNQKWACRFQANATGTLNTITAYSWCDDATTDFIAFIYDDNNGSPNAVLGYVNISLTTSAGWRTSTTFSGTIYVYDGSYYWLGEQDYGEINWHIKYDAGATNQTARDNSDVAPPDSTFGVVSVWNAYQLSIYATITVGNPAPSIDNIIIKGQKTAITTTIAVKATALGGATMSSATLYWNRTGSFANTTLLMSGTSAWANFTGTLPSAGDNVLCTVYINDSLNTWTTSSSFRFNIFSDSMALYVEGNKMYDGNGTNIVWKGYDYTYLMDTANGSWYDPDTGDRFYDFTKTMEEGMNYTLDFLVASGGNHIRVLGTVEYWVDDTDSYRTSIARFCELARDRGIYFMFTFWRVNSTGDYITVPWEDIGNGYIADAGDLADVWATVSDALKGYSNFVPEYWNEPPATEEWFNAIQPCLSYSRSVGIATVVDIACAPDGSPLTYDFAPGYTAGFQDIIPVALTYLNDTAFNLVFDCHAYWTNAYDSSNYGWYAYLYDDVVTWLNETGCYEYAEDYVLNVGEIGYNNFASNLAFQQAWLNNTMCIFDDLGIGYQEWAGPPWANSGLSNQWGFIVGGAVNFTLTTAGQIWLAHLGGVTYANWLGGGPPSVTVTILQPTNTTYTIPTIAVEISAGGGTIDKIWWNCKNGSSWIYGSNLTYTIPTSMTGFVDGTSYVFYGWANNTDGNSDEETVMFTVSIYTPPTLFPKGGYYYFITGTRTTNNVTGSKLDSSSGFALSTVTQTNAGNCTVSYAFQVSIIKHDGSLIDVTGITAIITRSDLGEGFQNGYASISYTTLVLGYQAIRVRLYICFDGEAWYVSGDYVTEILVEKAVDTSTWNFTVYTKRSYNAGTNITSAQFMFGDQSHNSRIENVAFIDPLAQEIALWKLESGDIIGGMLYPFMLYTGDLIYGLGIMFVSGVLYLRHKKWEVILTFFLLYAGGAGIGYLIPDVAYRLVYIIIWFVLTIVLYRVFR